MEKIRIFFALLAAPLASAAASDQVKVEQLVFERVDASVLETGGVFSSDFSEVSDILKVPPPDVRKLFLFADRFYASVRVSNIGQVYLEQVGIWNLKEGRVSLHCGSPVSIDNLPCESFDAWRIRSAGTNGSLVLAKVGDVSPRNNVLDVLLGSVAFERTLSADDSRKLIERVLKGN